MLKKFLVVVLFVLFSSSVFASTSWRVDYASNSQGKIDFNNKLEPITYASSGSFTFTENSASLSGSGSGSAQINILGSTCSGSGSGSVSLTVSGQSNGQSIIFDPFSLSPEKISVPSICKLSIGDYSVTPILPMVIRADNVAINLEAGTVTKTVQSTVAGQSITTTIEMKFTKTGGTLTPTVSSEPEPEPDLPLDLFREPEPEPPELKPTGKMSFFDVQELIMQETGSESEAAKGAETCAIAVNKQIQSCSTQSGWMVDNVIEVVRGSTSLFQDTAVDTGGCIQNISRKIKIDTNFIDSTTDDFQVLCSINCYAWDCPGDEPEPPVENAEVLATVEKIDGNLWIKKDGESAYTNTDSNVKSGQEISTAEGSATISLASGDELVIGRFSSVTINSKSDVTLNWGRIKAKIRRYYANQFRVRTGGAVVAVRGTEFIIDYYPEVGPAVVHLNEGEIDVITASGVVAFSAGNSIEYSDTEILSQSPLSPSQWASRDNVEVLEEEKTKKKGSVAGFIIIFIILSGIGYAFYWVVDKLWKTPHSKKALLSAIIGFFAVFVGWVPVLGTAAIITGFILGVQALTETKKGLLAGKGLAITGLVLSVLATWITIIAYLA